MEVTLIKKALLIGLAVIAIMALTVSTALAAQGQITEVNPSGIGKAIDHSDGRVKDALKGTPAVADGSGESTEAHD